jgi:hypothetical protein
MARIRSHVRYVLPNGMDAREEQPKRSVPEKVSGLSIILLICPHDCVIFGDTCIFGITIK